MCRRREPIRRPASWDGSALHISATAHKSTDQPVSLSVSFSVSQSVCQSDSMSVEEGHPCQGRRLGRALHSINQLLHTSTDLPVSLSVSQSVSQSVSRTAVCQERTPIRGPASPDGSALHTLATAHNLPVSLSFSSFVSQSVCQ